MDFEVKEKENGNKMLNAVMYRGCSWRVRGVWKASAIISFLQKAENKCYFNKKQHFKHLLLNREIFNEVYILLYFA